METLHLAQAKTIYTCPYNKSHRMPRKTLVMHLKKCPDHNPDFKSCTFNNFHVMPSVELEDHEANCPDRVRIDSKMYESKDISRPKVTIDCKPSDFDDDWGDDSPQLSKTLENISQRSKVMQPAYGLTKSQRKKYRSELSAEYFNVDLSFNKNLPIHNRPGSGSEAGQSGLHQTKGSLFIGKRPDIQK